MNPVTNTYAITNANIVQAPGRVITNGTVVIKNGIITAVGTNVNIPSNAHIIKGDSMYVYAGFIDGLSNAGIAKPADEEMQRDVKKMDPPYKWAGIAPQNSAGDFLNPKSKDISNLRSAGFAFAQVAPHGKMLPGTTTIITLSGNDADELVYEQNTGFYSQLQGAQGVYPNTVIGVMAKYRDLYRQAGYAKIHEANYAKNPAGMERPTNDRVLQAFYPVPDKKMPVIFKSDGLLTTHRVLALQQDLGFNLTLANVKEGWDVIAKIKSSNAKVMLSLSLPKDKIKEDDNATDEAKALEGRKKEFLTKHYSQAATFEKSGIAFGFSTLGTKPADIQKNIRTMVENGLSENGALAALTTNPASILGLTKVAGTVDKGKLGNVVVTTDSYFGEKSQIKYVIVDGDFYEFKAKPQKEKGRCQWTSCCGRNLDL